MIRALLLSSRKYTDLLGRMCEEHGLQAVELNGDYVQRYRKAAELVDRLLEE